jgi:mRNA interferase MazF
VKRGDLVTVALQGDFGKPRPALVIQSDLFDDTATVTVLLLSGTPVDAPLLRLDIQPTDSNGLRRPSRVMVDKIMTIRRDKVGPPFGTLDEATLATVTRSLVLFLGIG